MAQIINLRNNATLNKVRSKYILAQIFDNLQQEKKIEIVRYNKNFRKLLKIRITDYRKAFSKIEIDIIPKENEFGRFIHIPNTTNNSNYNIYFNDNKKEDIKRMVINENDNVKKIKVILNHKIKSLYGLFLNCKCIKKIKFIKFNRSNIKNMMNLMF